MDSFKSVLIEKIRKESPLKELYIQQQVIDDLQDELWSQPIERLYLEEVSFEGKIPGQLFDLSTLKELRLCCVAENNTTLDSGNYINEIPSGIENLTEVEELDFSGNNLKGIPKEISGLHKLKNLDLSENDLESAALYLPPQLERLDLSGNGLTQSPN